MYRSSTKKISFISRIKNKYNFELIDWLKEELKSKSASQISQENEVSWNALKRWVLEETGVKIDTRHTPRFIIPVKKEDLEYFMEHNYTTEEMSLKLGTCPNTIRKKMRLFGLLQPKETLFQAYDRLRKKQDRQNSITRAYHKTTGRTSKKIIQYGTPQQIRNREVFEFFKDQYSYLLSLPALERINKRDTAELPTERRIILIKAMNANFPDKAPFLKDTIDKMIKRVKEGRQND